MYSYILGREKDRHFVDQKERQTFCGSEREIDILWIRKRDEKKEIESGRKRERERERD